MAGGQRFADGRFDALTAIAPELSWSDLLPRSHTLELSGITVRVLKLEAVIESKEAADRDKDRAALPLLRETLRLKRLRDEPPASKKP